VTRKPKQRRKESKAKKLAVYFVMFLVVLGLCARPFAKGAFFYQTYWGGAVFIPFILLLAVGVIVIAIRDLNKK
jgi:hypothetical protein